MISQQLKNLILCIIR